MENSATKEKVIIGITTYNLEEYIGVALDSVLKQKVNFAYKILVVDDASIDRTREILLQYKEKYPNKIDLIFKKENTGSLSSSNILFDNIKSEYFAFLDGDDYWLSDSRLQEAVDFLDNHVEYSMYGGNTLYLYGQTIRGSVINQKELGKTFTYDEFLKSKCPFVHTSSIVLRNLIYNKGVPQDYKDNEKTNFNCVFRGEDIRFIEHLRKGKIYIANKEFSVYRIHNRGVWQGASLIKREIENCLSMLKYQELFVEGKSFFEERFIKSYCILLTLIKLKDNEIFQLSKIELELLSALLCEMRGRKFNVFSKKKMKLKYRIYHWLYEKLKKKLEKKGLI